MLTRLFTGRGYKRHTLGADTGPNRVRYDHCHARDDATVDQIVKQLNKLVNVLHVHDFREGEYVDRELVLVKVAVDSKTGPR